MCAEHGRLLANAVDWATNKERPVTVTGPGVLDVTLWAQKVRVRLPEGRNARRVQLLVSGQAARFEEAGGWVSLAVPGVGIHEVVAVDL